MRGSREISPAAVAVEVLPTDASRLLDLPLLFGRRAPIEVDLGCGDGAFLSELAREHPERNFLGIERLFGRTGSACKRIVRMELSNARILRREIPDALEHLFAPKSVDVFHLMFPDPWPKRRHHCRRVFTPEFLQRIARALIDGGTLRVATDDSEYFDHMRRVGRETDQFSVAKGISPPDFPRSTFEKRFLDTGLEIHRLMLRKVSDIR